MTTFPASGAFDYPASPEDLTNTDFAGLMEQSLAASKELPGALPQSSLTIAGGAISVDRFSHSVDTESSASADDLTHIHRASGYDVRYILIRPANVARVVTLKHGAGGDGELILDNGGDYALDKASKCIILERIGAQWVEVNRTGWDDAEAGGQQLFTASGDFTVPAGITRVYVTIVPGGGGGGGGAGATGTSPSSSTDGTNGSDGGASYFGAHVTVAGGKGGGKGLGLGRGGAAYSGGHHGGNKVGDLGGLGGVAPPTVLGAYGKGGSGGAGADGSSGTGGGGGAAGSCGSPVYRQKVDSLTPLSTVAVTVGSGGAGGSGGTGAAANGTAGSTGANGAVLVEW